jgi:tetratricopeptide (TPR) repeat protein
LIIATDNGAILYYSRQYDAAIKQLQAVLDMDPNFPRAHIIESAYAGKGMFREALSDLERQRSAVAAQWYWSSRANICGRSAQIPQARQALQELKKLTQHQQIDPAVFISAYLGIGDREQTLFWLERARMRSIPMQ